MAGRCILYPCTGQRAAAGESSFCTWGMAQHRDVMGAARLQGCSAGHFKLQWCCEFGALLGHVGAQGQAVLSGTAAHQGNKKSFFLSSFIPKSRNERGVLQGFSELALLEGCLVCDKPNGLEFFPCC